MVRPTFLVRLYPARWRARYGVEFSALLEELPASPHLLADVIVSAVKARLSQSRRRFIGGPANLRGANENAIVALALMVPSLVVVLAFALKFKLGVAGPFDAISRPTQALAVLQYFLVFAPWLSLALVSRAVIQPSVRWSGGGLSIQLEARGDRMHLAIALVAVLLLFVLMRYFVFQQSPVWGWSAWSVPWPWFPPPWEWR